jgi:hypothetical protein
VNTTAATAAAVARIEERYADLADQLTRTRRDLAHLTEQHQRLLVAFIDHASRRPRPTVTAA